MEESSEKTSTRRRKQPVFYEPAAPAEKGVFRIPEGAGTKLKDIPAVATNLDKAKADDPVLVEVHRVLFKRIGTKAKRKQNIKSFCGFDFAENETNSETEKLKERIAHIKGQKRLADFFGLDIDKGTEERVNALVNFLLKPEAAKKETMTPPKKETPKKKITKKLVVTKKRKAPTEKSKPKATKKTTKKAKTSKDGSKSISKK